MWGHQSCTAHGDLNDSNFSSPMPWIGLYIAAASSLCALAMAADLLHGFRRRKFWFPCTYFSVNATTLTVLGVALKLSLDLNTPMPSRSDQASKVASSALISTVLANSMPSIAAAQSSSELLSNIAAVAILVVTLAVNLSIQIATGAIFVFLTEHIILVLLMLVLLLLLSFSAITVPTTKRYLQYKFTLKHHQSSSNSTNYRTKVATLRHDMTKFWVMAHTCSPQFVMARSVTCTAAGALSLAAAAVLAESLIRSFFMPTSFHFCLGESDYRWSTTLVLIAQTVAVMVGTIAPALRWLLAIRFRCPYRGNKMPRSEFRVERYWIQCLEEMKDCPVTSSIFKLSNRNARRFAHDSKNRALDLCIAMQIAIVFSSKIIRFVSIFSVSKLLLILDFIVAVKRSVVNVSSNNDEMEMKEEEDSRVELSRFVLHLEGEEALVDLMIKRNCDATQHWFRHGKKKQPGHLIKLLYKSSQGFNGLAEFDSDQVPSLDHEDPPNSWALAVVTLTSIAFALPDVDQDSIKRLRRGVAEGLFYVKNMEKYLDTRADLSNLRKAAEVTWTEVDLYHKWLGVDLRETSLDQEKTTPRQVLERFSQIAKDKFKEFKNVHMLACFKESPLKWHPKVLAANSMYRISQALVLFHCERSNNSGERVFEAVSRVISDILCACMTNLHQVISVKCLNSAIEEREESVRLGVSVLGKTEEILEILDRREIPCFSSKQMGCIDAWCSWVKSKDSSQSTKHIDNDVCIAVDD